MEKVKYERETEVLRGCNLGGVLRSTSLRRWHLNEDWTAVRKYIDIWGKSVLGRGSSLWKGLKGEAELMYLRSREEANVTGGQ